MIGYTPTQINDMSIWQYMSAVEGYAKAHNPDSAKELSPSEEAELWAWMETKH